MIKIRKYENPENPELRYHFWLDTFDDQEESGNIQDQIIAVVWGWA